MSFANIPPEINSALMYAGPGSGPMLAAADAWESTATELYAAAHSYAATVSALVAGPWRGSSSSAMAAAASSYVSWLSGAATVASETATQATAAAVAYEVAFAATVPPEVVAANRSLLMALVSTNLLGQNTAAIAATEAQYAEMWAQDAAAMFGYAGSAASATRVTPFSEPQQTVNAPTAAGQATAVSQAAASSPGAAQGTLSQLAQAISAVPNVLSDLGSSNAVGSLTPLDLFDYGADLIAYVFDAPLAPMGAVSLPIDAVGAQTGIHSDEIISAWAEAGISPGSATISPNSLEALRIPSSLVTAGVNEANSVGGLSVPPSWTAATPAVRPIALALPAGSVSAAATGASSTLSDVALSSVAGRALADTLGTRGVRQPARATQDKPTTVSTAETDRADEASAPSEPRTVVTGIAAEIRDLAKLRDEGLITDEQFVHQRNRLLDL